MVSNEAIEKALELLDNVSIVEESIIEFATEQTAFLQYLQTEGFKLLTQEERDYLQYLALVIYQAVKKDENEISPISGDLIEQWDEKCWEWMQQSVGKSMTTRLDNFFDAIDQEELLAFAEDSLVDPEEDDEDQEIFQTGASREMGMVALGVFIGCIDDTLTMIA